MINDLVELPGVSSDELNPDENRREPQVEAVVSFLRYHNIVLGCEVGCLDDQFHEEYSVDIRIFDDTQK
jgi:hypothetical protein